ncbi:hypothetical protein HDE_09714 [Halotydeus destructor]|nr:hypothetical protein HDE_09714 [Halotydeus destructor]
MCFGKMSSPTCGVSAHKSNCFHFLFKDDFRFEATHASYIVGGSAIQDGCQLLGVVDQKVLLIAGQGADKRMTLPKYLWLTGDTEWMSRAAPPVLDPATVSRSGSRPKAWIFSAVHFLAMAWSHIPMFLSA